MEPASTVNASIVVHVLQFQVVLIVSVLIAPSVHQVTSLVEQIALFVQLAVQPVTQQPIALYVHFPLYPAFHQVAANAIIILDFTITL